MSSKGGCILFLQGLKIEGNYVSLADQTIKVLDKEDKELITGLRNSSEDIGNLPQWRQRETKRGLINKLDKNWKEL